MGFKKFVKGSVEYVIRATEDDGKKFRPGFRYKTADGTIYTIVEDVSKDADASMRKIKTSDGGTEILDVQSIRKDLKESGTEIMEPDEQYAEKEEEKKEEEVKKEIEKKDKEEKKEEKWIDVHS